jgi:hypothetical protein
VVLVREPVAPVGGAVGGEAVDDRRLQLLFAFGAGEDGKARDCDEGAAERLRVWVFEYPVGVELALWLL